MSTYDPFAELNELQEEIRETVRDLAQTVTAIVGIPEASQVDKDGHVEREVQATRAKLNPMRLRERMLLDQAAAQIESRAGAEEKSVWAGQRSFAKPAASRMPERIQEAILVELVTLNASQLLQDAPGAVLLWRLRAAVLASDVPTEQAIKGVVLRRIMETGAPAEDSDPPYSQAAYLLMCELGAPYTGYPEELGPILQLLVDAEASRLSPESRSARDLVRRGTHRKRPLDLTVWAGDDPLLGAVIGRIGPV